MIETKTTEQTTTSIPTMALLQTILTELRAIRTQLAEWFPFDNLEEYEHPTEIKNAYENALNQYPPHV